MRSKFTNAAVIFAVLLAFSVAGVASASAHSFTASKTPGTLTGRGLGKQEQLFKFEAAGPTISCDAKIVEGKITTSPTETLEVGVKYENCAAPEAVTITPTIKYLFHASGTVDLQNEIPIKYGPEFLKCVVAIPAAKNFGNVPYKNILSPKEVEAPIQASGFFWKSSGTICNGWEAGGHNNGVLSGPMAIGEKEGSLEFK